MFERRILFILGAGASAEVGFPMGRDLADQIASRLNIRFQHGVELVSGDAVLWDQFGQKFPQQRQDYQAAALRISNGVRFSSSIDDFLDIHSNDQKLQLIGKAAVVRSILQAEHDSELYFDLNRSQRLDFDKIKDTWYVKFMRMFGRGNSRENVRQIFDNVSFIVFNYDRCLEHFLFNALPKLFAIADDEAREIIEGVNIIHPYGTVGDIAYGLSARGLPFGGPFSGYAPDYIALAENVKTYSEQNIDTGLVAQIGQEVRSAQCIVFLGFGFHKQNLMLLQPGENINRCPVFATGYGFSSHDIGVIKSRLERLSQGRGPAELTIASWVNIDSATCTRLF